MTEPQAQAAPAETAAAPSLPSPGTLLRAAREKAGLTAEDLGGQLKLAKGTLEALERDDFAALSEPVYVRGYYRKIAKLLPVSEKELIAGYNARNKPLRVVASGAPSRIPLAGGVAAGASRHSFGPGLGVIALAAIAVVIVLFLFMDREPARRLVSVETPPATAPAEKSVAAPAAGAPAEVTAPVTGPAATPAPAASAPAPAMSTAPAAGPAVAAAPKAEPVPAVANQLVLTFSESSFVRVEDSRGKTLAIGLVRSGERQTLDGAPPYTVFLGNAKNVKVYFNGQPVDFSAHVNAQNDTARFMVP